MVISWWARSGMRVAENRMMTAKKMSKWRRSLQVDKKVKVSASLLMRRSEYYSDCVLNCFHFFVGFTALDRIEFTSSLSAIPQSPLLFILVLNPRLTPAFRSAERGSDRREKETSKRRLESKLLQLFVQSSETRQYRWVREREIDSLLNPSLTIVEIRA